MPEKKESNLDTKEAPKESSKPVCRKTYDKPRRKPIPKDIIHKIQSRDRGRCTYFSPVGKRCKQTRWLQFHHVLAVAHGGKDVLENLTTLCFSHHRLAHGKQRKKG